MLKKLVLLLIVLSFTFSLKAQKNNCTFLKPSVTVHFGNGNVEEINSLAAYNYDRVPSPCPTDGHYSYVSETSNCFGGDWFDITEDHTPGDASGNMMLVNSSYRSGPFFTTSVNGLKPGTTYEFAVWMMNVCRITDKCPYPLLPDIAIRLLDTDGKVVTQVSTGALERQASVQWTQYKAVFTTPASSTGLIMKMINYSPGGCGNDFVMDDITFRECVIIPPPVAKKTTAPATKKPVTTASATPPKKETNPPATVKKSPPVAKPAPKKATTSTTATTRKPASPETVNPSSNTRSNELNVPKQKVVFPPAPKVLTTRSNPLVKQIEAEAGDISIALYDNGQIDGDTVSIYHNNQLLVSRARLSQQPISFKIKIDDEHPHHEIIMVAENLGSIPPNTSVMIVNTLSKKYEVFISSSEQKNAKVVFDLK